MLCMLIFNNEKKIIGVILLVNKLNGVLFNENDVNIIEVINFILLCIDFRLVCSLLILVDV